MKTTNLISGIYQVIPYTYEEKNNYHGLFEATINRLLGSVPSQSDPHLIHMFGIPGSGKTTYINNHKTAYSDYLIIGFDDLMEMIPAYQQDVKKLGAAQAYENWVLPARIAGYELLRRAVEAKKNIIFDHGGSPQCHQELLRNVKKFGYKTKMIYISCPLQTALERAAARELQIHRHIPQQTIIERFRLTEQAVEKYKSIVDDFVVL